jgi:hypothetical protein
MPLRRTGTAGLLFLRAESNRGPGSAAHHAVKNGALRCVRGTAHASTVLPLLITVTPRAFTFASNEITSPSFHISMVTVSPG